MPDRWQLNLQENTSSVESDHLALSDGAFRLTLDGPQWVAAGVFQKP